MRGSLGLTNMASSDAELAHGAVIVADPTELVPGSRALALVQRPLTQEERDEAPDDVRPVYAWGKVLSFGGNSGMLHLFGSDDVVQLAPGVPVLMGTVADRWDGLLFKQNRKALVSAVRTAFERDESLREMLPLVHPDKIKTPSSEAPQQQQQQQQKRAVLRDPLSPEAATSKQQRRQREEPDSPVSRKQRKVDDVVYDEEHARDKVIPQPRRRGPHLLLRAAPAAEGCTCS